MSNVNLENGPILVTVESIVMTKAVDWHTPKRERKEYLSYTSSWEANDRPEILLDQTIIRRTIIHSEPSISIQSTIATIEKKLCIGIVDDGVHLAKYRSGQHEVYYNTFIKSSRDYEKISGFTQGENIIFSLDILKRLEIIHSNITNSFCRVKSY